GPRSVAGGGVPFGAVTAELPPLADAALRDATRNNRLLLAAAEEIEREVAEAVDHYGPARIGVVLGTSTTGIQEASQGIAGLVRVGQLPSSYHYAPQEPCT